MIFKDPMFTFSLSGNPRSERRPWPVPGCHETSQHRIVIMEKFFLDIPWPILVLACLTLGLAPYSPPHIWEKLQMLFRGTLVKPLDWFDLVMHGIPWILLLVKGVLEIIKK